MSFEAGLIGFSGFSSGTPGLAILWQTKAGEVIGLFLHEAVHLMWPQLCVCSLSPTGVHMCLNKVCLHLRESVSTSSAGKLVKCGLWVQAGPELAMFGLLWMALNGNYLQAQTVSVLRGSVWTWQHSILRNAACVLLFCPAHRCSVAALALFYMLHHSESLAGW